jgi:Fur family zinc uptake transcriptional regulator
MSAYELRANIDARGQTLAPMQIYRTLERLIASGRVCRIEMEARYALVDQPADAVAVCERCGALTVLLLDKVVEVFIQAMAAQGFTPSKSVIEAVGMCRRCQLA